MDCFTVPLRVPAEGAVLGIELLVPEGTRGEVTVLDSGNAAAGVARATLAAASSPALGQPALISSVGARAWERSYVVCTRAVEGASFATAYRLRVRSWTPKMPFEFEPNDTFATATALPHGVEVTAELGPNDLDVYRVSADPGRRLRVTVTPPAGAAPSVALFDRRGDEVSRARGASPGDPLSLSGRDVTWVSVSSKERARVDAAYRIRAAAEE